MSKEPTQQRASKLGSASEKRSSPVGTFYEFFAGAGMARAGLGDEWLCAFANEFDVKKTTVYANNWDASNTLKVGDVGKLRVDELPGVADLAWASFPCQDLSLAGAGAGLEGDRSGTFWPFWRLMQGLVEQGRGPKLIVLENVCGTLTSHGGKDFKAICGSFAKADYRVGAVVMDAVHFVPQSRPRLFVIGVRHDIAVPQPLEMRGPSALRPWHPRALLTAQNALPPKTKEKWIWWNLTAPKARRSSFSDLIEDDPVGVEWHSPTETAKLLRMMSDLNLEKVEDAKRAGRPMVGAVYKRTRIDNVGRKMQRAEIRFDGIAGCLRTPGGGSSRQVIVLVDGDRVRSRLISPRETARLMGLPEAYALPKNYNEAYHLTGDGVAVPVVRHLAAYLFEPLLRGERPFAKAAA